MKKFTIEVSVEHAAQIAETLQQLEGVLSVQNGGDDGLPPPRSQAELLRSLDPDRPENAPYAELLRERIAYWKEIFGDEELSPTERRIRYLQNWRPSKLFEPSEWTDEVLFGRAPELEAYF